MKISRELAAKVLSVVDAGLIHGKGRPVPGQMCVEAAVCFAMGLPHSDNPPCVGTAVRSFKITLNDSSWSSTAARTKGMRQLAIAQLGSDAIDQTVFVKELALQTITQIVPLALRVAAELEGNAASRDSLLTAALRCEKEGTQEAANCAASAASAASDAASAARAANCAASAASAASYAASYAARAAYCAASYAASAASYAASDAASAASYAASAASYAASNAAYDAASDAASAASDDVSSQMARIGVEVLKVAGSPGCAWLDLCEAA